LPEFSKIRHDGTLQFKEDAYEIRLYGKINKILVHGEWLNGKPHGICIVRKRHFIGIMTFTNGVNNGPGWIDGGNAWSFSKYDNREEGFDFGLVRYYNGENCESYVTSKE
jgi:hypothetical protein